MDNSSSSEKKKCPRIIALVDMDCFYVQVELANNPECVGKPSVVAQYHAVLSSGIIAVSYEARARNVTRGMRVDQAREVCPELEVFHVPERNGKSDLGRYRSASEKVMLALAACFPLSPLERASIDEAYLDITADVEAASLLDDDKLLEKLNGTGVAKLSKEDAECWLKDALSSDSVERSLCVAAALMQKARHELRTKVGYSCSAGISHSKTMAKLAAGLQKPNGQTILPFPKDDFDELHPMRQLFTKYPVSKVRNLGGKLGQSVQDKFNIKMMSDLAACSVQLLSGAFGAKTAEWLHHLANHGEDGESVRPRNLVQSIGCSKNFPPPRSTLKDWEDVKDWLGKLSEEVADRVNEDNKNHDRKPQTLSVNLGYMQDNNRVSVSRACTLRKLPDTTWSQSEKLASLALKLLSEFSGHIVVLLGISLTNFISTAANASDIRQHFTRKRFSDADDASDQKKARQTEEDSSAETDDCNPGSSITIIPQLKYSEQLSVDSRKVDEASLSSKIDLTDSNSNSSSGSFFEHFLSEQTKQNSAEKTSNAESSEEEDADIVEIADESEDVDYYKCPECGDKVLMFNVPEHNDFHVAQNVQKEMHQEAAKQVRQLAERHAASAGSKSKKLVNNNHGVKLKKVGLKKDQNKQNQATLDGFFTRTKSR